MQYIVDEMVRFGSLIFFCNFAPEFVRDDNLVSQVCIFLVLKVLILKKHD